ncbi:RNA polymerase sigma factor [Cohnella sp.]|uniref:RNA polymerase sigma factor n=1 Tax=Cohnella sp. TaxID=1883426 RepID=UPI0035695CFB
MILTEAFVENKGKGTGVESMEQLHNSLIRYCLSLTESHWDAEDLAQDTWVKAMRTFKSLGHSNPEAFMLRIAKNTWIDQARRKTVLDRIVKSEQPKILANQLVSDTTFEIEAAFQALIKHLSPLQRAVFLLRDVFGFSNLEAANMLHTTEGAVKAVLHRARHSLILVRADIEKEADHPIPANEDLKAFLRSLTSAYQIGDVASLIALVQRDEVEPAVAIGIVQNKRVHSIVSARKAQSYPATILGLQLAA